MARKVGARGQARRLRGQYSRPGPRLRPELMADPKIDAARLALPGSVGELTDRLRDGGYIADRGLATALFVSMSLGRPILVEGEVGVGKTEVAKVLASQ